MATWYTYTRTATTNETTRNGVRERRKGKHGHSHAAAAPAPTLNAKHVNYVMIIFQYIFFHIKEKPHHETLFYRYQSGTSAAHFFTRSVVFSLLGEQKGKKLQVVYGGAYAWDCFNLISRPMYIRCRFSHRRRRRRHHYFIHCITWLPFLYTTNFSVFLSSSILRCVGWWFRFGSRWSKSNYMWIIYGKTIRQKGVQKQDWDEKRNKSIRATLLTEQWK